MHQAHSNISSVRFSLNKVVSLVEQIPAWIALLILGAVISGGFFISGLLSSNNLEKTKSKLLNYAVESTKKIDPKQHLAVLKSCDPNSQDCQKIASELKKIESSHPLKGLLMLARTLWIPSPKSHILSRRSKRRTGRRPSERKQGRNKSNDGNEALPKSEANPSRTIFAIEGIRNTTPDDQSIGTRTQVLSDALKAYESGDAIVSNVIERGGKIGHRSYWLYAYAPINYNTQTHLSKSPVKTAAFLELSLDVSKLHNSHSLSISVIIISLMVMSIFCVIKTGVINSNEAAQTRPSPQIIDRKPVRQTTTSPNIKTAAVHYTRGKAFLKERDIEQALAEFQSASELVPNEPKPLKKQAEIYLFVLQDDMKAVACLEAMAKLNLNPKCSNFLRSALEMLCQRGRELYRNGNSEEAKARFEWVLRIDPHHTNARRNLAYLHTQTKQVNYLPSNKPRSNDGLSGKPLKDLPESQIQSQMPIPTTKQSHQTDLSSRVSLAKQVQAKGGDESSEPVTRVGDDAIIQRIVDKLRAAYQTDNLFAFGSKDDLSNKIAEKIAEKIQQRIEDEISDMVIARLDEKLDKMVSEIINKIF